MLCKSSPKFRVPFVLKFLENIDWWIRGSNSPKAVICWSRMAPSKLKCSGGYCLSEVDISEVQQDVGSQWHPIHLQGWQVGYAWRHAVPPRSWNWALDLYNDPLSTHTHIYIYTIYILILLIYIYIYLNIAIFFKLYLYYLYIHVL